MRHCSITEARLPRSFLLGFELISHPETGAPWLAPSELESRRDSEQEKVSSQDPEEGEDEDEDRAKISKNNVSKSSQNLREPTAHACYISARYFVVDGMAKKKRSLELASKVFHLANIVHPRIREKFEVDVSQIVLREDMPEHILRLLRLRVIKGLAYLASRVGTGYITAPKKKGLKGVATKKSVSSVLWLGPSGIASSAGQEGDAAKPDSEAAMYPWDIERGPPDYMTVPVRFLPGGQAIVFNLPRLLGKKGLAELRKELGWIRDREVLVLKHSLQPVAVQMWLWRLQGYMAEKGAVE